MSSTRRSRALASRSPSSTLAAQSSASSSPCSSNQAAALVAVEVEPTREVRDPFVECAGALAPARERLFGELALVTAEDARERPELVEPRQLLADALVGLAALLAQPRKLVRSSRRLDSVVRERLEQGVQSLDACDERLARKLSQRLARALDRRPVAVVQADPVLDRPQRFGFANGSEHLGHRLGHRRLDVQVERQLLPVGALDRLCGRLARHGRTRDRRGLVDGELLTLATAHRCAHRLDRLLGRSLGRVRRDLGPAGAVVVLGDEVDMDGVAGT